MEFRNQTACPTVQRSIDMRVSSLIRSEEFEKQERTGIAVQNCTVSCKHFYLQTEMPHLSWTLEKAAVSEGPGKHMKEEKHADS